MLPSRVSLRPPPALSVALLKVWGYTREGGAATPGPQGPRPKSWPQQPGGRKNFPHGTGPSCSWHSPQCLTTQSIPLETQASNNGHVGTPAPSSGCLTPSPNCQPREQMLTPCLSEASGPQQTHPPTRVMPSWGQPGVQPTSLLPQPGLSKREQERVEDPSPWQVTQHLPCCLQLQASGKLHEDEGGQ